MRNLLIIGAGGFGREVYNSALESLGYGKDFIVKGFLDDRLDALDTFSNYPPVIDRIDSYSIKPDDVFVCALGTVTIKKKVCESILSRGGDFFTLIHTDTYISMNTKIGKGCILLSGARIHCDVSIGDFVVVQPYAIIGHDVVIGDWSHINALADCGGGSRIGECVTLHTSSFVLPSGIVEDNSTVGAGSVVLRRVKEGSTVFGVPAKIVLTPKKQ